MLRARFLLLSLCCLGCGQAKISEVAPPASSSATASTKNDDVKLTIVSYDGVIEHIAANRGKVVVMDAWSTSCPPCMKEFHNLVDLHRQYKPEQLACISLSFDYEGLGKPEEVQDRVLDFLQSQRATLDNLLSNEESDVLYRKFKLAAVPAVFVYDREGKLRQRFDNEQTKTKAEAFTYEQVQQLVTELLAEGDGPSATAKEAK